MVKRHLKKIASPKSWEVNRKHEVFITRPNPGAHPFKYSITLSSVLSHRLGKTVTKKETKTVLREKEILVDGRRRKEPKFSVGLMDVVSLKDADEHYRVVFNKNGKMALAKIDAKEASIKPCRVKSKKTIAKGKIQLSTHDGRVFIVDSNDYSKGDTIIVKMPEQKIDTKLSIDKGSSVYIVGGKHIGTTGKVESIGKGKVTVKTGDESIETAKKFVFAIGKDKPVVTIE